MGFSLLSAGGLAFIVAVRLVVEVAKSSSGDQHVPHHARLPATAFSASVAAASACTALLALGLTAGQDLPGAQPVIFCTAAAMTMLLLLVSEKDGA